MRMTALLFGPIGLLTFAQQAGAATVAASSFTQLDFQNGDSTVMDTDYFAAGKATFTLDGTNEGKWILGNVNGGDNAYFLSDVDTAGNTSIYMSPKNSGLRGFVQHLDEGSGKWTGNTTISIDYVADGTGTGNSGEQFFTLVVFAWNDTDPVPELDIHGNNGVLYDQGSSTYNGLSSVFSVLPTLTAETPHIITTDQTNSDPWLTTQVAIDLGGSGYDNFGVMIAADGGEIWFDNLQVVIPEPSSLAFLGLSGLALTLRRRK